MALKAWTTECFSGLAGVEGSVNKSSSLVRFRSSASLSIKAINIRPQGIYGLAAAIRTA